MDEVNAFQQFQKSLAFVSEAVRAQAQSALRDRYFVDYEKLLQHYAAVVYGVVCKNNNVKPKF